MKNTRTQELAGFLRSRREKLTPAGLGIEIYSKRRRTPGLRREEVAQLAGIGLTWYTWLEQGRDINVSAEMLESISKALQFSKEERIHLFTLAKQNIPTDNPIIPKKIDKNIVDILKSLKNMPSYVIDHCWNILAWNDACEFLFGDLGKKTPLERNALMLMFTDSYYQKLFDNWTLKAKDLLARFRAVYSRHINDDEIESLIKTLQEKSPEFKSWWMEHNIMDMQPADKIFYHPLAGELNFKCTTLDLSTCTDIKIIIHTPCARTLKKLEEY